MPPLSKPTSFLHEMLEGKITDKNIPNSAVANFKYSVATPKSFADREVVFNSEEFLLIRSILKHLSAMEEEINTSSEKIDSYLSYMKENKEEMINEKTQSTEFVIVKFTFPQANALYEILMNLSTLHNSIDSSANTKKIDDLAYLFHKAADHSYQY